MNVDLSGSNSSSLSSSPSSSSSVSVSAVSGDSAAAREENTTPTDNTLGVLRYRVSAAEETAAGTGPRPSRRTENSARSH